MSRSPSSPPVVVVSKKNLNDLSSRSFKTKLYGQVFQGFVVRKGDKYFAYQNLCQHLPVPLDLNDGGFLSHDKKFIQCQMHGATYAIETGFCVAGPCDGQSLVPLEIVVEEESQLVIKLPDNFK